MSRAWIDVDLDAVIANYQEVVKLLRPATRCMAVVKADAYGLGAVEVSHALQEAGCEAFAVTTVEEGLILRRHGIKGIILVLGPSTTDELKEAVVAELHLTISDLKVLGELEKVCNDLGRMAEVHIKLETGMGRTGFQFGDLDKLACALQEAPHVHVAGVYTHFARAAQRDKSYTRLQYERFRQGVTRLEELGYTGFWQHVCNSAAFLDHPEWQHDFVRIGTLLFGHYPGAGFAGKLALSDPWAAKAPIVYLRKVPKGTFVGYQSTYRTPKDTQLAVIPVGYADGFGVEPHLTPQGFGDFIKIVVKNLAALVGIHLGREKVELHGQTVSVAGKIGMQLTVLDVGTITCQIGDEVKIPLRRTLANPGIMRQYWRGGQIRTKRIMLYQQDFGLIIQNNS